MSKHFRITLCSSVGWWWWWWLFLKCPFDKLSLPNRSLILSMKAHYLIWHLLGAACIAVLSFWERKTIGIKTSSLILAWSWLYPMIINAGHVWIDIHKNMFSNEFYAKVLTQPSVMPDTNNLLSVSSNTQSCLDCLNLYWHQNTISNIAQL